MRKLLLVATSVVSADYCYSNPSIAVRVALQGDKLDISASAPNLWVGVGVPKSPSFDEMARGQFVMGGAGQIYEYSLEMDYNWKPDKPLKSVVEGTGRVSTVGGYTNISFSRMLMTPDTRGIDPTQPFFLLWAQGGFKPGQVGYAALDYHHTNRGHVRVDLKNGNCGPAPTPSTPSIPSIPVQTGGKKTANAKGKVACGKGKVACTAKLQKEGQNCVIGACVMLAKVAPPNNSTVLGSGKGCTRELRPCPDGVSLVGRVPPDCAFQACPAPKGCTRELKPCPDGSSVGRMLPSCEFQPCPSLPISGGLVCTADAKMCPDGSYVGRVPPSCAFKACPGGL